MQSVFLTQMDRLLQPAYLLTGSHEQAAQCLLEAYDACINAHGETYKAAKRAVVTVAVRRIATDLTKCLANGALAAFREIGGISHAYRGQDGPDLSAASFSNALLSLNTLQRATLVLRLYERYSTSEAASLLGVSCQTLENGWQPALLSLLSRLNPAAAGETALNVGAGTMKAPYHI